MASKHSSIEAKYDDRQTEEGCLSVCCRHFLTALSVLLIVVTFPFSLLACFKIVSEYERAVVFRLGCMLNDTKGPGMVFYLPCVDSLRVVDLRTRTFDVPKQEVLTRDSVTVTVDAVVYYHIARPQMSVVKVQDALKSTLNLAQTSLRNVLGTHNLAEILAQRDQMAEVLQRLLDEGTEPWGIQVQRVEVKDVVLPKTMQRAMAKEAEAKREAQAKIIAADGEKQAARSLREAALVIGANETTLQLRYLQTLGHIATEHPSTIYFPLPIKNIGGMQ